MNVLWVFAHPDSRSLSGSLRDAGVAALRARGHRVDESDLYALQWNPVVTGSDYGVTDDERLYVASASKNALLGGTLPREVVDEQRKLLDADAVVLQFPLWWFGMPAIMKGWVDRVFVEGFGYGIRPGSSGPTRRYGDGLLAGTRALIVTTTGGSHDAFSARGINGQIDELLFPIQHGIFWYTGMSALPPHLVADADRLEAEQYEAAESALVDRLGALFTEHPIRFRHQNDGSYDRRYVLRASQAPGVDGLRAHVV